MLQSIHMTQDWYDVLELGEQPAKLMPIIWRRTLCSSRMDGLLPGLTRARRKASVMETARGWAPLKKGYCVLLSLPHQHWRAEIQPYPSPPKMPTFKTLPLWGIGWQYKWHHEIINYTWVNFCAVTHRAVLITTNDTNLRCKQESVSFQQDN